MKYRIIDSVEGGGLNRAIGIFLAESYDFTVFLRDFGSFFPQRKLREIVGYFTQILQEIPCFSRKKMSRLGVIFF